MKHLIILGTRGVPAEHGGFETFAEYLALYLLDKGWKVTVYCQQDFKGQVTEDTWQGVNRVLIPIALKGGLGTMLFDLKAQIHSLRHKGVYLTLGYNTAILTVLLRIARKPNIINMDGIEWKRQKWSTLERAWLFINERLGCYFADQLIADHPEIAKHLSSRVNQQKISTISYGAEQVKEANSQLLLSFELKPREYLLLIARAEPENSILEIVKAFSAKQRDYKLVILGNYEQSNSFHRAVMQSASEDVIFLGAIYAKSVVQALRYFCKAYMHGHQVGGTNPSLVEALGAANAVIAHDNVFNRWVAGQAAYYFKGQESLEEIIDSLLSDEEELANLRANAQIQFSTQFQWVTILGQYQALLEDLVV